ncbi:hypothetical protein ABU162_15395 [Paenibacillus thiaminolyticus]|uniref:hypothetical protein n=1 Tax=Paenibacillus thiaminolyticus TaxID=49283 RepID=UPI0035A6515B
MITVNYGIAMKAENGGPVWLKTIVGLLEGRASALFVVLAGIGVALMTAKARGSGSEELLRRPRISLCRRSGFLFAAGLLLVIVGWNADILHIMPYFCWSAPC